MNKKKISIVILISIAIALGLTLVGGGIYMGVKSYEASKEEYQRQEIKSAEKVIAKDLCRQYDGIKSVDFWGYDTSTGDGFVDVYMKINDKYPAVYTISGYKDSVNSDSPNIEVYALGTNNPKAMYRDPYFYMVKGHTDFKGVKVSYKTDRWKGEKFSL